MKRYSSIVLAGLLSATALFADAPKVDFPAPSPASTLKQRVGLTDIEVVYSRPGVKGRKIFGDLQPYGQVWRAGANSTTKITFSTPVKFGGVDVPAGSYGLFAIPGQDSWTVILSKTWEQWGTKYDQKDDLVRVTTKPVSLGELVETYTIDINDIRDDSATLNLIWEKTKVPVKFQFDLTAKLSAQIEAAMASPDKKSNSLYARSAQFYLDHGLDLKKASTWIDQAVSSGSKPDPTLLNLKAQILAKQGDKAGAIAAAKQSSEAAVAAEGPNSNWVKVNEALTASLR